MLLLTVVVVISLSVIFWKSKPHYPDRWEPRWAQANSFSIARRALAAVASNSHLYVIGGINNQGKYVRETEYASIDSSGKVGTWQFTSSLAEGRFYLAAVIVGDFIYALGGGTGPVGGDNQPSAMVERARINADGSLADWELVSYMQLPRRGLKAVAFGNRIYAIGGYSGIFLKSTEHVLVNPDGSLGEWSIDPQEANLDRYIHSASYAKGRIYLLGGHVQRTDKMSYGDVESAAINAFGQLNPWEIEPSKLLQARFISSSFALGDYLYLLGGHNGGRRLHSVEFARIFGNGRVGNWSMTTPLNTPRSAAATAVSGNYVYVLGGMGNTDALNSVEYATSVRNGQLGTIGTISVKTRQR